MGRLIIWNYITYGSVIKARIAADTMISGFDLTSTAPTNRGTNAVTALSSPEHNVDPIARMALKAEFVIVVVVVGVVEGLG